MLLATREIKMEIPVKISPPKMRRSSRITIEIAICLRERRPPTCGTSVRFAVFRPFVPVGDFQEAVYLTYPDYARVQYRQCAESVLLAQSLSCWVCQFRRLRSVLALSRPIAATGRCVRCTRATRHNPTQDRNLLAMIRSIRVRRAFARVIILKTESCSLHPKPFCGSLPFWLHHDNSSTVSVIVPTVWASQSDLPSRAASAFLVSLLLAIRIPGVYF